MNPLARLAMKQVGPSPVFAIIFVVLVECLCLVSRRCVVHFFLHRDNVTNGFRTRTVHGRSFECLETDFTVKLKLHGRHLQHLRTVLEAILGCRFRRQTTCQLIGQTKQILQSVVILILCHAPKRRVLHIVTPQQRSLVQFVSEPIDNASAVRIGQFISWLVFWWHLRVGQDSVNLTPAINVWPRQQIRVQLVDPKSAFRFSGPMAPDTVLFQNGTNPLSKEG